MNINLVKFFFQHSIVVVHMKHSLLLVLNLIHTTDTSNTLNTTTIQFKSICDISICIASSNLLRIIDNVLEKCHCDFEFTFLRNFNCS